MTEQQLVDKHMLDWKNMMDANGHFIPFERDVAIDLLEKHPDLFDLLKRFLDTE